MLTLKLNSVMASMCLTLDLMMSQLFRNINIKILSWAVNSIKPGQLPGLALYWWHMFHKIGSMQQSNGGPLPTYNKSETDENRY